MPRNARADAGTSAALTCADVRAREWDFVEGALSIPERAAVQTHLDACAACRQELTLCRNAQGALVSATTQIPSPGDLRTDFYARLATQQRPSYRYGRPLALSALALSLLAAALIRPALQTGFVPHATVANDPASLAAARPDPKLPPALLALPPTDAPMPPFHLVPGLSEAQADRLFTAVETKYIVPFRQRTAQSRPSLSRRLRARPVLNRTWAINTPQKDGNVYSYMLYDRSKHGVEKVPETFPASHVRELALSKESDLAVRPDPRLNLSDGNFGYRVARLDEAVSVIPTAGGVSLEVTDQVRGFSNTTRVASDVEVQGGDSTIHVEADGN